MNKKEKIPKAVRNTVWLMNIKDKNNAKCFCCKLETITNANWHCGHIISESKGGMVNVNNLRPICAGCNSSMGKNNMYDFMKKYGFDTIGTRNTINQTNVSVKINNRLLKKMNNTTYTDSNNSLPQIGEKISGRWFDGKKNIAHGKLISYNKTKFVVKLTRFYSNKYQIGTLMNLYHKNCWLDTEGSPNNWLKIGRWRQTGVQRNKI